MNIGRILMANIGFDMKTFENAYFDKSYKTRDGRKAIFLYYDYETNPHSYNCWVEGVGHINYNITGKQYDYPEDSCTEFDIISEWQEPHNEEELDSLAKEEYPKGVGVFTSEGAELLQKHTRKVIVKH